jgi:hypothetical protein
VLLLLESRRLQLAINKTAKNSNISAQKKSACVSVCGRFFLKLETGSHGMNSTASTSV